MTKRALIASLLLPLLLGAPALQAAEECSPDPCAGEDCPPPAAKQEPLERDAELQEHARRLLSNAPFRFCTHPSYRLWQDDKQAICKQPHEFLARCPGLEQACERPAWEDEPPPEAPSWLRAWFETFHWGASLARLLFWFVLALGVFLGFRALLKRRNPSEQAARKVPRGSSVPLPSAPTVEASASASELLDRARLLLEQGAIKSSLDLFYQAIIVTLAEAQLVRAHRSKTTSDYVQSLHGPLRNEVRELTSALDGQRFRPSEPSLLAARELEARTRELRAQILRTLPLAMFLLCIGCTDGEIREVPLAPGAPQGFALFEQLLERDAASVSKRIRRLTSVAEETTTVIALAPSFQAMEWQTLQRWVDDGGHLIVADPNEEFQEVFGLDLTRVSCKEALRAPNLELLPVGPLTAFSASLGGDRLASCGTLPVAELIAVGGGWISLIASQGLFQNRALAARDNATLVLELAASHDAHVELLGPWTGQGARHPLESLSKTGIGLWALHLMALLMLYAWAEGRRFGTPVPPASQPRRAFIEHMQALASQYARSHASGLALSRYADWAWETLRRRVGNRDDTPKSLSRVLGSGSEHTSTLGRSLILARKADELGETEREHVERFRALEGAVGRSRRPQ